MGDSIVPAVEEQVSMGLNNNPLQGSCTHLYMLEGLYTSRDYIHPMEGIYFHCMNREYIWYLMPPGILELITRDYVQQ